MELKLTGKSNIIFLEADAEEQRRIQLSAEL